MKINQYRLFTTILITIFSFTGVLLIIFGLIKHDQLLYILDHFFRIKFNEFTNQYSKYLQIRCLNSGVFLIGISSLLFWIRKKVSNLLFSFQTSSKEIFAKSKTSFFLQFSGSNLKYTITLFVIFFLAIIIRLYFITCPMRYDEGFTYYYFSKKSFFLLIFYYEYPNHHIIHTFLLKISTLLFGDNLIAVRLPAFVFGVTLIPLVYIYVAKFYQKNAAILATTFVSVSSILISYSVNARGYTMIYCAFVSLLIIVELLKKRNNTFLWGLFILIQVLGVYTILTMIYSCMIIYLYLGMSIIFDKKKTHLITLKKVIISGVITLLASIVMYLPICILMGHKYIISNEFVKSQPYTFIFSQIIPSLKQLLLTFTTDIPIVGILILFIGLLTGLIIYKNFRYYTFSFIICLLFAFFIQKVIPFNRVLIFIYPLFFCISAVGITYLINKIIIRKQFLLVTLISLFTLITLSFVTIKSKSPSENFDFTPIPEINSIVHYLKKTVKEKDRIVCIFPMESSLKSYFYFHKIPNSCFINNPDNSNKIFVLNGSLYSETVDVILAKSEINVKKFHENFYLVKKRIYSDKTEMYEFQHR